MGSSGSSVQAVPVIAIGRPQGAETIIFGMVTSVDYYQNLKQSLPVLNLTEIKEVNQPDNPYVYRVF